MAEKKDDSKKKDKAASGHSAFPDLNELSSMGKTLGCSVVDGAKSVINGVKTVIADYKKKRK